MTSTLPSSRRNATASRCAPSRQLLQRPQQTPFHTCTGCFCWLFQARVPTRLTRRLPGQPLPHHTAPLPPVGRCAPRALAPLQQRAVYQLLRRAAGGRYPVLVAALRCNWSVGVCRPVRHVPPPPHSPLFFPLHPLPHPPMMPSSNHAVCVTLFVFPSLEQGGCGSITRRQKRRVGDGYGGQPDAAGRLVRGTASMVRPPKPNAL